MWKRTHPETDVVNSEHGNEDSSADWLGAKWVSALAATLRLPKLIPRRTLCWNVRKRVCTNLKSSWTQVHWMISEGFDWTATEQLTWFYSSFKSSYLVDPASSDMLVSKIKPCKSKYKQLYGETADGSLKQFEFIWWITTRNGYP